MTPNQRQDIDSDEFESGFDVWSRLIELAACVTAIAVMCLVWLAAAEGLQVLKHHIR